MRPPDWNVLHCALDLNRHRYWNKRRVRSQQSEFADVLAHIRLASDRLSQEWPVGLHFDWRREARHLDFHLNLKSNCALHVKRM